MQTYQLEVIVPTCRRCGLTLTPDWAFKKNLYSARERVWFAKTDHESTAAEMEHLFHEHPLEEVDATHVYADFGGVWACDACHTLSSVTGERHHYHCNSCNFGLCEECHTGLHPLHHHPLRKRPVSEVYPGGMWGCDRCRRVVNPESSTYHCSQCNFDLCERCFQPFSHPLHEHPLLFADTRLVYREYNAIWFCDHCGMTMRSGAYLSHHCPKCQFDLCTNCVAGRHHHLHPHELLLANSHVVYSSYMGQWVCDNCGRSSRSTDEYHMWHCRECEFDLCISCISLPPPAGQLHHLHPHELLLANSHVVYSSQLYRGQWVCDNCGRRSQSTGEYHVWHCRECQFDLCMSCISLPPPGPPKSQSQPKPGLKGERSQTQVQQGLVQVPGGSGDAELCVICMDLARNAGIIHGKTSHVVCCLDCARRLNEVQSTMSHLLEKD